MAGVMPGSCCWLCHCRDTAVVTVTAHPFVPSLTSRPLSSLYVTSDLATPYVTLSPSPPYVTSCHPSPYVFCHPLPLTSLCYELNSATRKKKYPYTSPHARTHARTRARAHAHARTHTFAFRTFKRVEEKEQWVWRIKFQFWQTFFTPPPPPPLPSDSQLHCFDKEKKKKVPLEFSRLESDGR